MNARRRLLQALLAAGLPGSALARTDGERAVPVVLGDSTVQLLVAGSDSADVVFVNVHENEQTSVKAARAVFEPARHRLVRLQAQGKRLVVFGQGGRRHAFDPNRIFSDAGLRKTLRRYGDWNDAAVAEVVRLRDALLRQTLVGAPRVVVALHNNGVGSYAIDSYADGGQYAGEAAAVTRAAGADPGDFFLVTQRRAYDALADCGFGVVLQREGAADDGSLSVRLSASRPLYVNVEARHGRLAPQQAMLAALLQRLPALA